MKFTIAAALCVVFCAACAGVTPEQRQQFASLVEPTVAPSPNSFILDQRDPKSKTTHYVGAFMSYNCEFGVDSFGDIGGASDKIARLERDLVAAFGPQPETPKAVL